MSEEPFINNPDKRPVPPEFDPEQEQNKAECAAIWYNYAREAEQEGDHDGAQMGFYNAWSEQPEEFGYFRALVSFLQRAGQINLLIKVYGIGIQLYPDQAEVFVNFSNLLNTYGFYERAKELMETWLTRDASCLPAWGNLGNALRGLGDYQAAGGCFEKILSVMPDHAIAGFNLSNILLAQQADERAWRLYENRLLLPGYERLRRRNAAPQWSGESLKGRSVLVYAEQGLGDTFMFSRYLSMLVELGADVYFEVQKPVAWLMEYLVGSGIRVISRPSLDLPSEEKTDYQIPLLSLAGIAFQRGWSSRLETYRLIPTSDRSNRAWELIQGLSGVKIGLCWQGNPRAAIDCGRSLPLETFGPLMDLEIDYVSLQARDGLESIEACSQRWERFHYLPELDEATRAYEETVALIDGVDLVITSDTAVAHLAGKMGKECWVLLQKYPEWRWGLAGDTTHWYPKMRLFRQETPGNWGGVIQKVKIALVERFPSVGS